MASKASPTKLKPSPPPSTPVKSPKGLRQRVSANGSSSASAPAGPVPPTTPGGGTLHVQLEPQGDGQYRIRAPGTPLDELDLANTFFAHTHASHHEQPTTFIKSRRFLFPLGLALGSLVAYFLLAPLDPNTFDAYSHRLSTLVDDVKTQVGGLPSFPELNNLSGLPAQVWKDLAGLVDTDSYSFMKNRDFEVGSALAAEGLTADFPVILVPGIISTGLESWGTEPAQRPWFRKRLWGSTSMIQAVLSDKKEWMRALSLDEETGLDRKGYKVRAAQGFDAASQFIQGYWVWQKIIENLSPLNYDTNNLSLEAYDWRLSFYNLEIRDHYFSRLKGKVEHYKKVSGKKTVLVGHSMGGPIILLPVVSLLLINASHGNFSLKWVEASGDHYGNGGDKWVDEHVEAFVNIAGPMLGVAKAMAAFLSGEMKDTVEINPMASYLLEKMFSRKERADLFRGWAGSASMWLKGGDAIWGDQDSAPDDPENATDTHGRFLSFREEDQSSSEHDLTSDTIWPNLTQSDSNVFILKNTPLTFQKMVGTNYSNGYEVDPAMLMKNNQDHTKWTNPLEIELPHAPNMRIYCLYGHGKETERSYWYAKGPYQSGPNNAEGNALPVDMPMDESDTNGTTVPNPLNFPLDRDLWIDSAVTVPSAIPAVRSGVKFGEGDGTVPLLSLGAMCVEGWKRKEWNPSGIKVITREQAHQPEALDLRGGPATGEHVDLLGSYAINDAVGRIAAGKGHDLQDVFVSNIREYVAKMHWPDLQEAAAEEASGRGRRFWG